MFTQRTVFKHGLRNDLLFRLSLRSRCNREKQSQKNVRLPRRDVPSGTSLLAMTKCVSCAVILIFSAKGRSAFGGDIYIFHL